MKLSKLLLLALAVLASVDAARAAEAGDTLAVGNPLVKRTLTFDGSAWRTTAFSRGDGSDPMAVESDEFHVLLEDGTELTVADFVAEGEPQREAFSGANYLTITYIPRPGRAIPGAPISGVSVGYAEDGSATLRKDLFLAMRNGAVIDRLEVERFATALPASRGGRGQPVFLGGKWFAGLEYPAGHSRHTDGNLPAADSAHFEMVGNYSYIDLDGHDLEKHPRPGLVRLFHFPGQAKREAGRVSWSIRAKTAVVGITPAGVPLALGFSDYLATVQKRPRVFLHYNNWFDPAGKSLKGDSFIKVWREFKSVLGPAGIQMHAMVPDNGWQDRDSIWQPSRGHFPDGMRDLASLGARLREEGSSLGLWNSIDSTQNNIGWGVEHGFPRAVPNQYFSQYFAHYCVGSEKYLEALEQQMRALVREGQLSYLKHDFNHLCCTGDGHGHLPTDRHGHEANVDGMIRILAACRDENPDIYQNLTNWMWYSPWWLMHGDALWMLAGDDGFNGNWPEISMRAQATTDRDVYIWRMFGDPGDRPLIPVSRLMTHGIVKNQRGQMQGPGDTRRDWADHVVMHYGRGTQMKEWYITPAAMAPDDWEILLQVHRWSERRSGALQNTVYVGGRPDEGQAYGYIGWGGDLGVLVARNPSPAAQVLAVPFDASSGYRGALGTDYRATSVYPYHGAWAPRYTAGETMRVTIPGYATVALEFAPQAGGGPAPLPEPAEIVAGVEAKGGRLLASFKVPDEEMGRCELLVTGYPDLPNIRLTGDLKPSRATAGAINQFPGYARRGMPSETARPWQMAGYDLRGMRGREIILDLGRSESAGSVEAWVISDRPTGNDNTIEGAPPAVAAGLRRQGSVIVPESRLVPEPPEPVTGEQLGAARAAWLSGKAFGVNGGEFGAKQVLLNGESVGELPVCGDRWTPFRIELKALPALDNRIEIRHAANDDKYKISGLCLEVELADGKLAKTARSGALTSSRDWAFLEGGVFESATSSGAIPLVFPTE